MKKTFGVATISYKRNHILRLFCASIKRLRKEFGDFPVICVGDADHEPICKEYGITHFYQENRPATEKWNTSVREMLKLNTDYIILIDSDDIMGNDYMSKLIEGMEADADMIFTHQVYFWSSDGANKGELLRLKAGQIIGVGKAVKSSVFRHKDRWWTTDKNSGMNSDLHRNIAGHLRTRREVNGILVDVKSKQNLNKFSFWKRKIGQSVPSSIFYDSLGEEELSIISQLIG